MKSAKQLRLGLVLFLLACFHPGSSQQGQSKIANKTDISFVSNGLTIKGWLFRPEGHSGDKLPAIVMAPGFSGTKDCNYQFFASNFSKAGFAVLLFDYLNFGESAGAIRGEVDPWQQVQAYRDALSCLETIADIDPARLGVWGGSYSGGHALVVGALDHRVKCLVAMTPFISGSYYLKHMPAPTLSFLQNQFDSDRSNRVKGGEPARIPVATNSPNGFSAIASPHAWEFIQSIEKTAPSFKNLVTLRSLEMQLEYEPGSFAKALGDKPKLFIVARNDELIPEQSILDSYNQAPEPKKISYLEGHHFSPYMEKLQEASQLAIDWFRQHLLK